MTNREFIVAWSVVLLLGAVGLITFVVTIMELRDAIMLNTLSLMYGPGPGGL